MPRPFRITPVGLLILIGMCLFAAGCSGEQDGEGPKKSQLTISTAGGEVAFDVDWAISPQDRATGLMYRRSLPENEGMIFDFGRSDTVSMWMRNTYIPLDMIFIDESHTIRTIRRRATPLSERTIMSDAPVRYVLEINGGLADRFDIRVGDAVSGL